MSNPFATLGLEPRMDLCPAELETRYLALSRKHHPDFNRDLDQVEVLTRSADINVAYRTLRDPWRRAEALIELRDPEALNATKTLCPMFLMEAMETREAALEAPLSELHALERTVNKKIEAYFADVSARIAAGEIRAAATLLHQSNYYRKALAELRERNHKTPTTP